MTLELKLLQSKSADFYANFSDLVIDNNTHDIQTISGSLKIQQQIAKFLLTNIGTSLLYPNYGTLISQLVNNRFSNAVITDIQNQIKSGLKYIKSSNQLDGTLPNIDSVQNINLNVINSQQLQINIMLILSDGTFLQIQEVATSKQ